ncbi:uncharacterized protein At2g38710-like isoform X3 [Ananas comosus]|uniref:Uncharacterized protein At2g38710-like isoform X3 n=1 Tax=Ananas comosus TaxID=4615 RepID=A0A6P5EPW1_ANACO|nr:uncharacterized protein At2g38710-like isoform X3 [Ananas comosus]
MLGVFLMSPLFVTWKKATSGGEPRLRGCIGTLEGRRLINGFRDYALTSALKDRRFPPIQAKELPYLECTVSILTNYETALHFLDWECRRGNSPLATLPAFYDPMGNIGVEFQKSEILMSTSSASLSFCTHIGKHGLIIEFTDPDCNIRRSATYLPEIAAQEGWTKIETIDSLMNKAGYYGFINESLRKKLHVTRYESTLYTMHYSDYALYVEMTRGEVPGFIGSSTINGVKPNH